VPPSANSGRGSEAPEPKPAATPDDCEWGAIELGSKCATPDEMKKIAFALCEAKGLALGDLAPALDCGGLGSSFAKVACCGPAAPPEADSDAVCKQVAAGDGTTCQDAGALEKLAAVTCASWGMALAKSWVEAGCAAGGATLVTGECCPLPANDSGPFFGGVVGDGAVCVPDDKLEDDASEQCQALGLVLLDFYPADDCEADASTIAKYMCGK
jgi:hypothetical protein